MKWQPFNVNDEVRVKLTSRGLEIHRRNFDEFKQEFPNFPYEYTPPKEDAEGWSVWQMHALMSEFGKHMTLAGPVPFHAEIELSVRDDDADGGGGGVHAANSRPTHPVLRVRRRGVVEFVDVHSGCSCDVVPAVHAHEVGAADVSGVVAGGVDL